MAVPVSHAAVMLCAAVMARVEEGWVGMRVERSAAEVGVSLARVAKWGMAGLVAAGWEAEFSVEVAGLVASSGGAVLVASVKKVVGKEAG